MIEVWGEAVDWIAGVVERVASVVVWLWGIAPPVGPLLLLFPLLLIALLTQRGRDRGTLDPPAYCPQVDEQGELVVTHVVEHVHRHEVEHTVRHEHVGPTVAARELAAPRVIEGSIAPDWKALPR